jgi:soluble lytic murein transglycosylase-like protein
LVAGLLLAGAQPSQAQIYSGHSEASGAVVLSNFESPDAPNVLISRADPPVLVALPETPPAATIAVTTTSSKSTAELKRVIDSVATRASVPAELLHAVIAVESNYDLKARSPKGAIGLMQLLPATARRFGAKDPYVAVDNVTAGAGYLKWLMALFHDDLELVLAAYNAGEQAVIKAGYKIPPYPETQAYVPRVLAALAASLKAPR